MIIPDVNLLLHAYDQLSPWQGRASEWWRGLMEGAEPVGLCSPVVFGFVRLATSAKLYSTPLTAECARAMVDHWMGRSSTVWLELERADVKVALDLLTGAGTAGNLTTDAQIAALALRRGACVHSADSDFARFPGVRWQNPLNA